MEWFCCYTLFKEQGPFLQDSKNNNDNGRLSDFFNTIFITKFIRMSNKIMIVKSRE